VSKIKQNWMIIPKKRKTKLDDTFITIIKNIK